MTGPAGETTWDELRAMLRAELRRERDSDSWATLIQQVCRLDNVGEWDGPIPGLHVPDGNCGLCNRPGERCKCDATTPPPETR
jgi:hypothetical protein